MTNTCDNLIQNRDTLAPLNAEVVFILRMVAVQYDVPGEDSDDDCDDEDEDYWLVDCIIYNVVKLMEKVVTSSFKINEEGGGVSCDDGDDVGESDEA